MEIGNQVDIEDERDGQHQDKEDADEYWKDEEVQHKEPNKMGRSQKGIIWLLLELGFSA